MNTFLTNTLPYAVKLTALAALAFALLKVILILEHFGGLAVLTFAGLHLPLCLFSVLVVLWFFTEHQAIGFLALVSALLNALLI